MIEPAQTLRRDGLLKVAKLIPLSRGKKAGRRTIAKRKYRGQSLREIQISKGENVSVTQKRQTLRAREKKQIGQVDLKKARPKTTIAEKYSRLRLSSRCLALISAIEKQSSAPVFSRKDP